MENEAQRCWNKLALFLADWPFKGLPNRRCRTVSLAIFIFLVYEAVFLRFCSETLRLKESILLLFSVSLWWIGIGLRETGVAFTVGTEFIDISSCITSRATLSLKLLSTVGGRNLGSTSTPSVQTSQQPTLEVAWSFYSIGVYINGCKTTTVLF